MRRISMIAAAVLALAPLASAQAWLEVQGADGKPASGAIVRWFVGEPDPLDLGALDDAAAAAGFERVTDERGRVELPEGGKRVVTASLPGYWAWTVLEPSSGGAQLMVRADADLVVETVDDTGAPVAGVPLAMRLSDSVKSNVFVDAAFARSDVNGRAVFRHATISQESDACWDAWQALDMQQRVTIGPHGLTAPIWCVQVRTTPASSGPRKRFGAVESSSPMRVEVGEGAAIRIEVVDAQGAPVLEGWQVRMRAFASASRFLTVDGLVFSSPAPFATKESDECFAAALERGVARFDFVPRFQEAVVLVRRNARSDWSGRVVKWEDVPGDARTIRVEHGGGLRTWRLRPLLHGERLRNRELLARVIRNPPNAESEHRSVSSKTSRDFVRVATDGEGVLTVDLDASTAEAIQLRVEHEPGWFVEAIVESAGSEGGIVDTPMSSDPIRAWTVVVDDTGSPLSGARLLRFDGLKFSQVDVSNEEGELSFDFGYSVFEVEADGHFSESGECYGVRPPERIVLVRHSALRGRVRSSNPQGPIDLNLVLYREVGGDETNSTPGMSIGCSCDGLFAFERLRAGSYTLVVRRVQERAPPVELFRREGIQVRTAETHDFGEVEVQ